MDERIYSSDIGADRAYHSVANDAFLGNTEPLDFMEIDAERYSLSPWLDIIKDET